MPRIPLQYLTIETATRVEMVDVTDKIQDLAGKLGVGDGFLIIHVPHTTAAVTINEHADPDVKQDILKKLDSLIPHMEKYYQHDEGNSDAHVKTALVGNSITVLIDNGQLVLGRWQGIFLCEFDGPRERRLILKAFSAE